MEASIYVLVDPRDGEIRYVGWTNKTLSERLASHLRTKDKTFHRARWLQVLQRLGLTPIIRLIQKVPMTAWEIAERYWIRFHRERGCRLTNTTDGGQGTPGKIVSRETRSKISAANAGKTRPRRSAATRALQRAAALANNPMNNPATRAKVSKSKTGKTRGPHSAAHRLKLSEAAKARYRKDAHDTVV